VSAREHRPPVIDSLTVEPLEGSPFLRRDLGSNQKVEEVAVEVGRFTEELGVRQDEPV